MFSLYTHNEQHALVFTFFFLIQKIGISDASSKKLLFAASHYLGGISGLFFFFFFRNNVILYSFAPKTMINWENFV